MRKVTYYLAAGMCCVGLAAGALTGCSAGTQAETAVQTEAVDTEAAETISEEDMTKLPVNPDEDKEADDQAADAQAAADDQTTDLPVNQATDQEMREDMAMPNYVPVFGPLMSTEDGSITIDNQSESSALGEMVIHVYDATKVLDAVNGYPVQLSDLKEGEMIYAYIGPAMTMSLPPQTNGILIFAQVPEEEDFQVPEYVETTSMEKNTDGSFTLTSADGTVYQVPADCQILPYLTRNIVQLEDITKGSTCMVWSEGDETKEAVKIVLFADQN